MNGRHRAWTVIVAVAMLTTLAACGKKAELEPPEETKAIYTYPKQYPNPGSVVPGETDSSESRERPPPPHAGGLSPFPTDRTTTTYQSGPPQ